MQIIPALDTMVCNDIKDSNLQINLYRKPTDQQFHLHAKSKHPSLLTIVSFTANTKSKSYMFCSGRIPKELRNYEKEAIPKEI